jgi:Neuraminidase (sialidase)
VCFLLFASASVAGAEKTASPKGKRLTSADRVVVQGRGYFPVLIQLKDGSLAAVLRKGSSHVSKDGKLEFIRSTDGGRTWSAPRTVVDSKWDDRNHALGQMPDGTIVCAYSELQTHKRAGRAPIRDFVPYYVTSSDNGKTWSKKKSLATGAIGKASPYGKITVTADGTALMAVYGRIAPAMARVLRIPRGTVLAGILRSRDNGKTWGDFSILSQNGKHAEPALLSVGRKRIIAAARNIATERIELLTSRDNGRTWSKPRPVTERMQIPADLIRLKNGHLLMVFGNRRPPLGSAAMISTDRGKTWRYRQHALLEWSSAVADCGYPSSVQLDDGTIVTMSYSVALKKTRGAHFAIVVRYTEKMLTARP